MGRTTIALGSAAALTCAALTPAVAHNAVAQAPRPLAGPLAAAGHESGLATALVRGVGGERLGTVRLRQTPDGVRVRARLHDLGPGFHGFHVHTTGSCAPGNPDDPFQGAGGHYPGSAPVDPENPVRHGDHAGDMPSLFAAADGDAYACFVTDAFTLEQLLDSDGSAVMVHADPDNFAHIPLRYTSSEASEPGPDEATRKSGDSGLRVGCGVVEAADPPRVMKVALREADGSRAGTVWMRQTPAGVRVTARVDGLPEDEDGRHTSHGFHGFHVHSVGSCEPGDPAMPFTAAGGHYPGPEARDHAEHAGDMPSLLASTAGEAYASFLTDRFTIAELADADGSAVMVHAGADNFANIPKDRYRSRTRAGVPDAVTKTGGDSGNRFACGVISAPSSR